MHEIESGNGWRERHVPRLLSGLTVLAGAGAFLYAGGYWENWPLLDRLSGPRRFRQYVADPVPAAVHDLRGGYSGFPSGEIRTCFGYAGNALPFLDGWTRLANPGTEPRLAAARVSYTAAFTRDRRVFLLLDEPAQRGCVYVPGH